MKINIISAGYVRLVEYWGSGDADLPEAGIIEAARMSTDKAFKGWGMPQSPGDEKLLAHLYHNKHMTPFEMAGMILEIKAPIFVFREWHRHRTQSYNEMSARYIPLPDENYCPNPHDAVERSIAAATSKNRQANAATAAVLDLPTALADLNQLDYCFTICQATYDQLLRNGWPKELARLPTPVARYSKMRAAAVLRNWMAFMTLRMSANAQKEIRLYAEAVFDIASKTFPRTMDLFGAESSWKEGA